MTLSSGNLPVAVSEFLCSFDTIKTKKRCTISRTTAATRSIEAQLDVEINVHRLL